MKFSRIVGKGASAGLLVAAVVALTSFSRPIPVTLVTATSVRRGPVRIHQRKNQTQSDSYNWSGYAATGATGSATSVSGAWYVPTVNCSGITTTAASSYWVGIDGYSSSTVEQIGTDSDCVVSRGRNGTTVTPSYYAWFEFYPQNSIVINFPRSVQPGDFITAWVTYAGISPGSGQQAPGPQFTVTIVDNTMGAAFSTTATVANAQQSSAEWIVEAPSSNSGILPLPNFGTVWLSGSATVGGVSGTIGTFAASLQELTMVAESSGNAVKAAPTALVNGVGFYDSWESTGP